MVSEFKMHNERQKFRAFIKSIFKNEPRKKHLSRKEMRQRSKSIFDEIRAILSRMDSRTGVKGRQLIAKEFINIVLLFKDHMNEDQKEVLASNLAQESVLLESESQGFVFIPRGDILGWWSSCMGELLNYNSGQILLATICAKATLGNGNISQISKLAGMTRQTTKTHLDTLVQMGLVINEGKTSLNSLYTPMTEVRLELLESLHFGSELHKRAFVTKIKIPDVVEELAGRGYLYSKVDCIDNPYISVTAQFLIIHQALLSTEVLMASFLKDEQLQQWLKSRHTNVSRMKLNIRDRVEEKILDSLDRGNDSLDSHYSQISKVLPIMRYIGSRTLTIDLDYLINQIHIEKYTVEMSVSSFSERHLAAAVNNKELQWDTTFFLQCLLTEDPWSEWEKKYPKQRIQFLSLNFHKQSESPNIVLPEKWHIDDIRDICDEAWAGDYLIQYLESCKNLDSLTKFHKTQLGDPRLSLGFKPSILKYSTHANFFIQSSSQNLSKSVKSVIVARPGHNFLFLDIQQMHFEILKALSTRGATSEEVKVLNKLTLESIAIKAGVPRKAVKSTIYTGLNGASDPTQIREAKISREQFESIKAVTGRIIAIEKFTNNCIKAAKDTGLTQKTKLGFQTILFQKESLAAGYLIHIIANEIIREWTLALDSANLSRFIVNIIHDELMLEIPISMNPIKTSGRINKILNECARKMLPNLSFSLHASVARRWNSNEAVQLSIGDQVNRPEMTILTNSRPIQNLFEMKSILKNQHQSQLGYYEYFSKNYLIENDKKRFGNFEKIFGAVDKWLAKQFPELTGEQISQYAPYIFNLAMRLSLNDKALSRLAKATQNFDPTEKSPHNFSSNKSFKSIDSFKKILDEAGDAYREMIESYPKLEIGGQPFDERLDEMGIELEHTKDIQKDLINHLYFKDDHPFTKITEIRFHLSRLKPFFSTAQIITLNKRAEKLFYLCSYLNFNDWGDDINDLKKKITTHKKMDQASVAISTEAQREIAEMKRKYTKRIEKWF
jgi:hypothetical protein